MKTSKGDDFARSRHSRAGGNPESIDLSKRLDSRFHGNDEKGLFQTFYETIGGKRFREKKGFTFLELMLVILLLGFMFLFAWPNFQGLTSSGNTGQAVLGLTGALRFAQSQAATTNCRHRVNLEIRENTFWISREKDKKEFLAVSSGFGQRTRLSPGLTFLDFQQPQGEKKREGAGYVEFAPTGWAEECTIHLRRGEEEIFTIFVHPLGGKIEILPGYVERTRG